MDSLGSPRRKICRVVRIAASPNAKIARPDIMPRPTVLALVDSVPVVEAKVEKVEDRHIVGMGGSGTWCSHNKL